jgi:hypothetical protein
MHTINYNAYLENLFSLNSIKIEEYTKPNDVWPFNFKLEVSYDVTLFMCQSRSTIFRGILNFVIFRPRDMQEYFFIFSIALEWR